MIGAARCVCGACFFGYFSGDECNSCKAFMREQEICDAMFGAVIEIADKADLIMAAIRKERDGYETVLPEDFE